jgi:hypothetical protein
MEKSTTEEISVFQTKYNEFIEDLLGALPEYKIQIEAAKVLDNTSRLSLFQSEVKVGNTLGSNEETDIVRNPGTVLPGVTISDMIWSSLSENTRKAIWEYVRILSICCFMEAGFSEGAKPAWMDDAMKDMKEKLESVDFQNIIKKFMTFFKSGEADATEGGAGEGKGKTGAKPEGIPAGFEKLFENGFPKIPEKFLKGHMAKLAQEIVKDITPEDLGISPELIAECEKNPSRAFDILFQVFGSNPGNIQKIVQRIGKRLQQKFMSGSIRPQEIAREAEELMKEFAENSNFVDMMDGIKSAFGFQDMDLARAAGRESSARLSMVKERLKKKASEKEAKKSTVQSSLAPVNANTLAQSEAALASLLREEETPQKNQKKKLAGNGGKK